MSGRRTAFKEESAVSSSALRQGLQMYGLALELTAHKTAYWDVATE